MFLIVHIIVYRVTYSIPLSFMFFAFDQVTKQGYSFFTLPTHDFKVKLFYDPSLSPKKSLQCMEKIQISASDRALSRNITFSREPLTALAAAFSTRQPPRIAVRSPAAAGGTAAGRRRMPPQPIVIQLAGPRFAAAVTENAAVAATFRRCQRQLGRFVRRRRRRPGKRRRTGGRRRRWTAPTAAIVHPITDDGGNGTVNFFHHDAYYPAPERRSGHSLLCLSLGFLFLSAADTNVITHLLPSTRQK